VRSKKQQFDKVIQAAQRSRELERIISEHKVNLEKDIEEDATPELVINEDALGQAVQDDDDPDRAHRLLLAMQRTDATHVDSVFHFFDSSSSATQTKSSFPIHSLPKHRWTKSFRGRFNCNAGLTPLTPNRYPKSRPGCFDWFRATSFPIAGSSRRTRLLDDKPEYVHADCCVSLLLIIKVCSNHSDALNSKYLDILEVCCTFNFSTRSSLIPRRCIRNICVIFSIATGWIESSEISAPR
jgi:hypothetical protein